MHILNIYLFSFFHLLSVMLRHLEISGLKKNLFKIVFLKRGLSLKSNSLSLLLTDKTQLWSQITDCSSEFKIPDGDWNFEIFHNSSHVLHITVYSLCGITDCIITKDRALFVVNEWLASL